jgi:Mrp family chromosome partitioning ATPase
VLAPQVNGCLLVVEVAKTRQNTFLQAVSRLQNANVRLYGCIMNRAQHGRRAYYYQYDYYYQYNDYNYNRPPTRKRGGLMSLPRWLFGLNKR